MPCRPPRPRTGKRLGFVDITDPGRPKPAGTLAMGGEPTSVAHLGHLLLAGVNTRESNTDPSGKLGVRRVEPALAAFRQLLPTAAGPEGVVAVPSRGLLVVSSETEDPANNLRGAVQVYGGGHGLFPSIVSGKQSNWVQDKVEGLAVAGDGQTCAVTDNDAVDDATGETLFLRLGHLL